MSKSVTIQKVEAHDLRFPLHDGSGSDAVHAIHEYAFATTLLHTDSILVGSGFALTLGRGNDVVCKIISWFGESLAGREIEDLMMGFGAFSRRLANDPELRWLGPHKGAVHLALASLSNACFDLWAKARGVPLWRLLLDLSPEQLIAVLDLSYLEEDLPPAWIRNLLCRNLASRPERERILSAGYPGYDTSVGWFQYGDAQVRDKVSAAMDAGFNAFKLKVGSQDPERDIRRVHLLRETAGPAARVMVDANQQWTVPDAIRTCERMRDAGLYWIEEPTHSDDIGGHRKLAQTLAPMRIALGEHVPNRVVFANYFNAGAVHFVQPDCTRLAGVSEFLTVSLLARKHGLPVVPHVGDMGQIHQHLVLLNHIALGHEALFLEYIPHVREHLVHPARVEGGVYCTPQEPGSSTDLLALAAVGAAER
jgi:L-fuconate dehydratase